MSTTRKSSYPGDVTDEQWGFLLPYLTLMKDKSPQRKCSLRAIFSAVLYVVRTCLQWRYLANDFPPSATVADIEPSVCSG